MTTKTLSQRIEDAQSDLVREKDALTEHLAADDADPIVTEELSGRIESKEASLAALKRAEIALASRSTPASGGTVPATARRPISVASRDGKPRDLIVKMAVVNALSHLTGKSPEDVLAQRYADDEATGIVIRAAVSPATTTQSGWADVSVCARWRYPGSVSTR